MSKSNTFENALLRLIFNATPIAGLAANATSGPLTSLFVSLHTADPGEAGTQNTSEASYTDYERVAVARTAAAWPVTDNSVSPSANIDFPEWGGGSTADLTHFAIGTAATGAGSILYKGALSSAIAMGAGVTPGLSTGTVITED